MRMLRYKDYKVAFRPATYFRNVKAARLMHQHPVTVISSTGEKQTVSARHYRRVKIWSDGWK